MAQITGSIEAALRSGSRSKNFAAKIAELCAPLPANPAELTDEQRAAVIKMAGMCRAVRAVATVLSTDETAPAVDSLPEFSDLFCSVYYPVMEDGKRTVGFWSVKDSATLAPDDVHEWVRDRKFDKKTGKTEIVPVPFGNWWRSHRPDYDLYGVASDRALWNSKIIDAAGRKCVNASYGRPPVISETPKGYGDGSEAETVLDEVLNRTIWDADPENALLKRQKFVLDAGAHLLALRDFGSFRCLKIFCFTSTNGGQGTGKSLLHESIAALVPRDASVTVPTTSLAGGNLLPLYDSSVCILTEAPSTSSERYTAEDVKAFADAGWKTAEEKYVAKRSVRDNSLKLLSSNHLSPLPIDSHRSRRVEFFTAVETDDGGASLNALLNGVQARTGWSSEELRRCVGWALLTRAQRYLDEGAVPVAVARRTVDAGHLLSPIDYDYFVTNGASDKEPSYSDYRDFRTDKGITWSPDAYKFKAIAEMSGSREAWIDTQPLHVPPPPEPFPKDDAEDDIDSRAESAPVAEPVPEGRITMQYKSRMATAFLEKNTLGFVDLWSYVNSDGGLKKATESVRAGKADKRDCLRQIFPGVRFKRFSRVANILGFNGLVHVDFDHIAEKGNGLTAEQVRDTLAEMPGFVIGALSSRGNGAWAIFNAGDGIKDYATYQAAERSIFALTEERLSMESDHNLERPTTGRTLAYDPDCRIAAEALAGMLPEPFAWKAPTFAVKAVKLTPCANPDEQTADERVRNERFMEAVVDKACERVQNAVEGERHGAAVKAVANVVMNCQERGVMPLSSWGRRLREACASCGLDAGETNGIMAYWRQKTGLAG
ncbi:MAG: hypothetical protein BWY66_00553 [bacterium ADurb.Bin374]|nr:MAG: hypothetical protein BWY66_00553 [bacterium ADurb.Bin374]